MFRFLLLTLLLVALTGHAESVYRTTDAQGNVIFTDTPPADSSETERIGIPPTNTAPPPPAMPALEDSGNMDAEQKMPEYSVVITEPPNETSLPMGPGNFSVSTSVEPGLGPDESLQLLMNGEPWGDPQRETSWALTNVYRGQQDLTVAVVDDSGKALAVSAPVRVFVHRPSINNKNR